MSDEKYDKWVKDYEHHAWLNSLSVDRRKRLNSEVNNMIHWVLTPRIGPLSKEEALLFRDYF